MLLNCYRYMMVLLLIGIHQSVFATCNAKTPRYTPDSAFQLKVNGKLVLHKTTGLLWKRCSEGQSYSNNRCEGSAEKFTFSSAQSHAKRHSYAGFNDWRMPSIKELASIAELACSQPAINNKFFPNTEQSWYWSSSPNVFSSNDAWLLYFEYGYGSHIHRDNGNYARLVRVGQ